MAMGQERQVGQCADNDEQTAGSAGAELKRRRRLAIFIVAAMAASLFHAAMHAQGAPAAVVTALSERDVFRAGDTVRLALRVRLPDGLHVQADKPRDPSLIPTALTVEAPAGLRVIETVYPAATDLAQSGQAKPLAVFGHEFVIGLRLSADPSLPAGELSLPARLRYQACDDRACFAPATTRLVWKVRVEPRGTPAALQHQDVFKTIAFTRTDPWRSFSVVATE